MAFPIDGKSIEEIKKRVKKRLLNKSILKQVIN